MSPKASRSPSIGQIGHPPLRRAREQKGTSGWKAISTILANQSQPRCTSLQGSGHTLCFPYQTPRSPIVKINSCPPPTCLHCPVHSLLSGRSRVMRLACTSRLTWAVLPRLLLPVRHGVPNMLPELQNHLGLFFFLNKQEDHKVCLHDRPAKHKTPAVPWLRTWQLQQAGANIHSGIAPWGREPGVCTATVLSAVGLAGAQGGEGGLISLPCASRLHLGDNHNGAGCEGAFSRFPNFPLPISHQGNPCGYSLSPWDLGHDLPLH